MQQGYLAIAGPEHWGKLSESYWVLNLFDGMMQILSFKNTEQ